MDQEVSTQYKVEGCGVHCVEPMGNASRTHRHFHLTVPTTVHHVPISHADGCGREDVLQVPTRSSFLGHNGYGGPSIQYPQVFTSPKTDMYPQHQVCRPPGASLSELRGAGHFEPLLLEFTRRAHEAGALAGIGLLPIFVSMLGPLFLLALCVGTGRGSRVRLPTTGLRVPPWCRIRVPSGQVQVPVLVRLAVTASLSTFAFATLAFVIPLGLALAIVLVGVALATA